jgi:hypothetical protein
LHYAADPLHNIGIELINTGAYMAKYTASIDEDTRQRILALPRGIHFNDFMRKAMLAFLDELEKDSDLEPDNFVITCTARKDSSRKKH